MIAEPDQLEKHHDPLPALRQRRSRESEGIVPTERISTR